MIDAKKRLKGARVVKLPTSFTDGDVTFTIADELIVLTNEQMNYYSARELTDNFLNRLAARTQTN
jgi:hypothetical protein